MICEVDSREPSKYYEFLVRTFPGLEFVRRRLDEGDYQTEKVLVERKTIGDLYTSIVGTKDTKGRFGSQIERMSTHDDHILVLLVTGNLEDYTKTMKEVGVNFNSEIVHGEIGSVMCRYGIDILWIENEWDALIHMVKFMKKVDEGKWLSPTRRDVDILSARLLGISLKQWYLLKRKYGSLYKIAQVPDSELTRIHGLGPAKVQKIKKALLESI